LKSELVKKTLEMVGNPNILVNIVSRRVRQLNTGGGNNRPLVGEVAGYGAADIAMLELIEDKMSWEMVMSPDLPQPPAKKSGRK
jgi:DNA-directed RNA polymerase subunit omega